MSERAGNWLHFFTHLRTSKKWIFLVLLVLLVMAALGEFALLGLARRTFVFYGIDDGNVAVETRMLRISGGNVLRPVPEELDITRYVEEAILGPVSPDSLPLFPKETRLRSLLYRNGVVYADFSEDAVFPPPEGGEVLTNLKTLRSGITRNFPFVRDVRFLIAGKVAYTAEFR